MARDSPKLEARVRRALADRNQVSREFFPAHAPRLAEASREMAERFSRGGRLWVFGCGAQASDAQHVAVEFIHPVIVGKRALPAIDLSTSFREALPALVEPEDMVMAFAPPDGDPATVTPLTQARARGALTFALPGADADIAVAAPTNDPFVHQEMIEILYHTLWETVHVFLEHQDAAAADHDVGAAGFLYPFLGGGEAPTEDALAALSDSVAESIKIKASDVEGLRDSLADTEAERIAEATRLIARRIDAGGRLLLFGNGGSATDANDWAYDCTVGSEGRRPIPAVSLAADAAQLSAIANDVGPDAVFLRQLIAHARPTDVAIGLSTSGNSADVVAALEEGKKRGLLIIALTGYDGGEIARRNLADASLIVPCDYIPRIQEAHASIYHILTDLLGRY